MAARDIYLQEKMRTLLILLLIKEKPRFTKTSVSLIEVRLFKIWKTFWFFSLQLQARLECFTACSFFRDLGQLQKLRSLCNMHWCRFYSLLTQFCTVKLKMHKMDMSTNLAQLNLKGFRLGWVILQKVELDPGPQVFPIPFT